MRLPPAAPPLVFTCGGMRPRAPAGAGASVSGLGDMLLAPSSAGGLAPGELATPVAQAALVRAHASARKLGLSPSRTAAATHAAFSYFLRQADLPPRPASPRPSASPRLSPASRRADSPTRTSHGFGPARPRPASPRASAQRGCRSPASSRGGASPRALKMISAKNKLTY